MNSDKNFLINAVSAVSFVNPDRIVMYFSLLYYLTWLMEMCLHVNDYNKQN